MFMCTYWLNHMFKGSENELLNLFYGEMIVCVYFSLF